MEKQVNIPKLRFPDFIGNWQFKILRDIAITKVTNSFSRDNLNYYNGHVKNIHYGDIHTKFSTLFDIEKEIVPFVNEDIYISKISEDNYCIEGDIIFADASEDLNDVGKSIEIINLRNQKLLAGLHTILVRPYENTFRNGFAGYLFKSAFVRTQIQKESQGSKVLSISGSRLLNTKLFIPSLPEQTKIASFLTTVYDKLQALKKKKQLLEQYKKGVMQKIFSQELRFKDDNGNDYPDWEEKKLGEVLVKNSKKNKNQEFKLVQSVSNKRGFVNQDEYFEDRIIASKDLSNYYVIQKGDFAYNPSRIDVGSLAYKFDDNISVISPLYISFKANRDFLVDSFLLEWFNSQQFTKQMNSSFEGSVRNTLSYESLRKMGITIPSIPEQTKIANFLSAIDDKIKVVEMQIEKMEVWKKGLLQQMFC